MMAISYRKLMLGLAAPAVFPGFAQAEEAAPKVVTVSANAGLVSDYRFRGVSQSDKHIAVQGGVTATHKSGFYVGFWGSNLAGWGIWRLQPNWT
jgi:uncharacterized protein (TIGR02001 family)